MRQQINSSDAVTFSNTLEGLEENIDQTLFVLSTFKKKVDKIDHFKDMAFGSMEFAAAMSHIMQLLEKSANINTVEEMADHVFQAMAEFQWHSSILYAGNETEDEAYFSNDNVYRPKERIAMGVFRGCFLLAPSTERFKTGVHTILATGKHVTLVIRQVPEEEEALGKLRDLLGFFINAMEAIAYQLKTRKANKAWQTQTQTALALVTKTMASLQHTFESHERTTIDVLNTLSTEMHAHIDNLGLSELQEECLNTSLRTASSAITALYDNGLQLETEFDLILQNLKAIQSQ